MKFWNVLGTASRYVLAAIFCISLAQFLVLLNVGTEKAGFLAGKSFAGGVVSGLLAAVLFYRARKVRPQTPTNVQTYVQVTPPPKSQAQPTLPPPASISAMASTSVPTTDHSSSSFLKEHKGFIGLIAVAAIAVVFSALAMTTGMSHQPRFVHQVGAPAEEMFDNKTVQACWAGPVQLEDSIAEAERINEEMKRLHEEMEKESTKCRPMQERNPNAECPAVEAMLKQSYILMVATETANNRTERLIAHPEERKVIHVNGLPYCSELK